MPNASIKIKVTGLKEMEKTFARASEGLSYKQVGYYEKTLEMAYRATRVATHVDTGGLRLSGHPSSHFDGHEWEGEIAFARHPGIFELARGDTPSKMHPEGGHFFFNAVEPFIPEFEENMDKVFRDIFNEKASI